MQQAWMILVTMIAGNNNNGLVLCVAFGRRIVVLAY